jgi:hypothetical protein
MNTIAGHRNHALPRVSLGSPWLRTRVWLSRHSIDQRLAEGESILAGPELAHRAEQLASIRSRRSLAAGIRGLIEDAERPSRPLSSAAPIQRRAILRARAELTRLAAELEADEPIRLEGIARVQLLITDGSSPLYSSLPDGALEEAVLNARAAFPVD